MGWFMFGGDITNGENSSPPKKAGRPLGSKNKPKGSKASGKTKKMGE